MLNKCKASDTNIPYTYGYVNNNIYLVNIGKSLKWRTFQSKTCCCFEDN